MNYLFYVAHPSHYYVLKNLIECLKQEHKIYILSRSKDILDQLLDGDKLNYINISSRYRKDNKISIISDALFRNIKYHYFIAKFKIDRVISCASDIGFPAKNFDKSFFLMNDDDYFIVPYSAKYGWPYSDVIFAPKSCDMGKFKEKTVFYPGYQKLFYLHPNVFKPDRSVVDKYINSNEPFFMIRSVSLTAHHDKNIRGLNNEIVVNLVDLLARYGKVYIFSERELPDTLAGYKLSINPLDLHHLLYYAHLVISDGQSMVQEAALLGTPSLRYNDFVGKIGVMEELEQKYGLTYGISPDHPELLIKKAEELAGLQDTSLYKEKAAEMMKDVIDPNKLLIWFFENYPVFKNELRVTKIDFNQFR